MENMVEYDFLSGLTEARKQNEYEKKLKSKKNKDEALEDVVKECQKIAYLLNNLGEEEVTNNELTDLIEGFEKVTGYLFKNDPRVSEEVEKVMGGNVYKTRSEILLEEGMEKGREEGREEINALTAFLIDNNRLDDLKRATKDSEYQEKLLEEMRQIK
ncbi:MAG: hypothetical protein IKY04_00795 [Lachnospiraceae bacterium]|nr:hypothetical protein [Lachnospiraceae bacterium]